MCDVCCYYLKKEDNGSLRKKFIRTSACVMCTAVYLEVQLLQDDDTAVHEAVCLLLDDANALLVQLRHEEVPYRGTQGLVHAPLVQRFHRLLQCGLG